MSDRLFAQVTADFPTSEQPSRFLVVAAENIEWVSEFSENGYDGYSADDTLLMVEVIPSEGLKYANEDNVIAAAEKVGIQIWMNFETFQDYYPNSQDSDFEERGYRNEFTDCNQLLENPKVISELESNGFQAFKGSIVVTNTQPDVACFWRKDTFDVKVMRSRIPSYGSSWEDEPDTAGNKAAPAEAAILWLAEFETRNTNSRAVSTTPEDAVEKLVFLWKNEYAPQFKAEPDLIDEYREEIKVAQLEVGKAYIIGATDSLWHGVTYRGDDSRFDDIFEASRSPKP